MMSAAADDIKEVDENNPFEDPLAIKEVNMTTIEFEAKYLPRETDGFNIVLKTTDPNKFRSVNFEEFNGFLSEQLYETSKNLEEQAIQYELLKEFCEEHELIKNNRTN